MWRGILSSLKSEQGLLDVVTVLLPEMTSKLVSRLLGLLYTGKLSKTPGSQLGQTIKLAAQILPDLNITVGEEDRECLVLEVTMNNINPCLLPSTLDTVVTHHQELKP